MRLINTNRYAAVTATLALFLSLGGTSYAVSSTVAKNSVGSKQIVNGSVKSADIGTGAVAKADLGKNAVDSSKVADNSLTGADVKESSLGQVPSAATAGNATTAGNSSKVNGQAVYKVRYSAGPNTGAVTIFEQGGLKLTASCAIGADIVLTASTSKTGSSVYTSTALTSDPGNPLAASDGQGVFNTGDSFNLLVGGNGNDQIVTFGYEAPDGTIATGTLITDEYGTSSCHALGHVTIG